MKTYIELWKAKQTWLDTSEADRKAYLDQIGPAIGTLLEKGIIIHSWGVNDKETQNRADYDFFGVWSVPSVELAKEFEAIVEGAGWYNYFEQINVMGDAQTPQDVIPLLMGL